MHLVMTDRVNQNRSQYRLEVELFAEILATPVAAKNRGSNRRKVAVGPVLV